MKVNVVILNWNGAKLLREFLPSVIANTDAAVGRIVVADNGSTDESLSVFKEFPGIEVLAFDKNYGFAGGYNKALAELDANPELRTDYTILLNSDAAPAPGWANALCDFMDAHPNCGACQPKLLSYNDKSLFEYAGASGGFLDKHGYPYCRGRVFDKVEKDSGQYDEPIRVFWATGAAMMVRTGAYLSCGGLEAEFFAHMEEIDLCWRMQLASWEIWAVPQAVVYHLGGGSLPASNPRKTYLNFRNNLLMMHKNLPDRSRTRKLLVRRLLDALAWAKFVATFDFANAGAVWRAHRDFAKMRRQYSQHPDVDLLDSCQVDILVQHYLRGKNSYSQLK